MCKIPETFLIVQLVTSRYFAIRGDETIVFSFKKITLYLRGPLAALGQGNRRLLTPRGI